MRFSIYAVLSFALLLNFGCSQTPKKPSNELPSVFGPGVEQSEIPISEEAESRHSDAYGPQPPRVYPVILVFGPGLARAFAYAGVLRVLEDAKIPIAAVFGSGSGALFAALYSTSKTIDEFEWRLLELKEDTFLKTGWNLTKFFGLPGNVDHLRGTLEKFLGNFNIDQTRIPLKIGVHLRDPDRTELLDHGPIVEAVLASMSIPDLYEPAKWNGDPAEFPNHKDLLSVDSAKSMALGPVVAVDVLDHLKIFDPSWVGTWRESVANQMNRASDFAQDELNQADLVIRPNMKGISYFDFSKKTLSIFRGKQVALSLLSDIRALTGMVQPKKADDE